MFTIFPPGAETTRCFRTVGTAIRWLLLLLLALIIHLADDCFSGL